MKKQILQFHSRPEELLAILNYFRENVPFAAALWQYQPQELISVVKTTERFDFLSILKLIRIEKNLQLILGIADFSLPIPQSIGHVIDTYPESTIVQIGLLCGLELQESSVSSITNGAKNFSLTQQLKKLVILNTTGGAWAVGTDGNAEVFVQSHRYSPGALKLAGEGIVMTAVAGRVRYKFKVR